MNRTEFETLRDLQNKVIRGDIVFSRREQTKPFLIAEAWIENTSGYDVRLNIRYNIEVESKTFAVDVRGVGPICRLDVDGHNHPPVGRHHKHALQTEKCANRNLPDGVTDYSHLAGQSLRACFAEFCRLGGISHEGQLNAPDEGM